MSISDYTILDDGIRRGAERHAIHDRVVCGISNKDVQRRLLQEPDLTFDKALEMVQAAETAERDSRRLRDCEITAGNQEDLKYKKREESRILQPHT